VVRKIVFSDFVILAVLILLTLMCLLPVLNTVAISFSDKDAASSGRVFLLPVGFTTIAYETLSKEALFVRVFANSVVRVILGGIINVFFCILTAYPLSKHKRAFKSKMVFMWFVVFTMLFNGGLIPNYLLVTGLGLTDTIWALVLPGAVPVFSVIILMNYFKGIPSSLEEAAFMDGANPYTIMWRIYVPLAKASLAVIALFSIVTHWNSFFDGLIYINKEENRPLQTYIQQLTFSVDYQRMNSMEAGALSRVMKMSGITFNSAKLVVSMIPILVIYPLLQRYFVHGVVMGAVKE
jgi:ABC-type glycerol-3-phosphate transport system permease component